jgi:hypothetical protein
MPVSPTTPATPLTIRQAAAALKMSPRNLREICERNKIGVMVSPRLRILSTDDLPKITAVRRPVGNPNFQRKKSRRNR